MEKSEGEPQELCNSSDLQRGIDWLKRGSIVFLLILIGLFLINMVYQHIDWREDLLPGVLCERLFQVSYSLSAFFHDNGRFPDKLEDLGEYASSMMAIDDPYTGRKEEHVVYRRIIGSTDERFELFFSQLTVPAIIGRATMESRAWKWETTPEFEVFINPHSKGEPRKVRIRQWPEVEEGE